MMDLRNADRATCLKLLESRMFGLFGERRIRDRLEDLDRQEQRPSSPDPVEAKKAPAHVLGVMNKTEERFIRDHVQPRIDRGESVRYLHEKIKIRLAKGTWYTPDIVEVLADGSWWIHEVKGGKIWDDAAVKFKVAAEQYPWWRWTKTQWIDGHWKVLRDCHPMAGTDNQRGVTSR